MEDEVKELNRKWRVIRDRHGIGSPQEQSIFRKYDRKLQEFRKQQVPVE